MAKQHCSVIVYEEETIKRTILIKGKDTITVGRIAVRVFLDTITEEIGHDYGLDYNITDLQEALDAGHIECNGGLTEIFITWPEKTVNADKVDKE